MSNGSSQQSLGDFAALLVREVAQALLLAQTHAPIVEVQTIRLRLGHLPEEESDPATDALILNDRYPLLNDGWQLELELDNQVRAKLDGVALDLSATPITLLDYFGKLETTRIKGISHYWAETLAAAKITTIRMLAELDDQRLLNLERGGHISRLHEFRGKARLLATPLPTFPTAAINRLKLTELLHLSREELQEILGRQRVSRHEIDNLGLLLDVLSIALDNRLLSNIDFGDLLPASGESG